MAKLLEQKKKDLELKKDNSNCEEFTNIMKNIVDNQENVNGYFSFFKKEYSIDCLSFNEFKDSINNDCNNKMFIDNVERKHNSQAKYYYEKHTTVNHITTDIDVNNDLVTYRLTNKS